MFIDCGAVGGGKATHGSGQDIQERIRNGPDADKVWLSQAALLDSLMETEHCSCRGEAWQTPGSETQPCPGNCQEGKPISIHNRKTWKKRVLLHGSFMPNSLSLNHSSVSRKTKG